MWTLKGPLDALRQKKKKNYLHVCKTEKYQITMASVDPAGIIPNLNISFGKGDSGSCSA